MRPRILLAGMGHAHLFVLEAAARGELGDAELIVCTGEPRHVYSGMVPGWLGGRYDAGELTLDTAALVRSAGAQWRPAHVAGLRPVERTVVLADGSTEAYDVCSVAVGSEPVGLDCPGAREHAVPLKPLHNVLRIRQRLEQLARQDASSHVVIVGGGLTGIEMAFAVRAQWRGLQASERCTVTLLTRAATLVTGRGRALDHAVGRALAQAGIGVRAGVRVQAVGPDHVAFDDGRNDATMPADLTLWATGPSAAPWLRDSGLPTDARGFLRVDACLRSLGNPRVFVAGDSATPASWPQTPKAGVYAVRMGPRLVSNLRHAIGAAARPVRFRPQRQSLALLNLGDGRAIASWGPFVVTGRWVMAWKDRLDRAFMARFAALGR